MQGTGFLIVAVGLLVGADDPKADDARKDVEALQGTWSMVSASIDGEEVPEDQVRAGKLVVEGDRYTATLGERTVPATFKVDASKGPRQIDFTYTGGPQGGQTVKGIYKIDGDRFVMCRALRPGDDRPTEFATGAESGLILVVWKRSKGTGGETR
jgi:uncharacterized protein (TIGR03067 family)